MKTYGLIGKTLDHSFSKDFFTAFFEKNDTSAEYVNIEVASESMLQEVLCNNTYAGLNVTIPFKEAIIPFLDELSEEAQAIGAVNTIKMEGDKRIGFNTDAIGFHQSIKPFLRNIHERAIVFGDGGAAKAVKYVLGNLGIEIINVVRTKRHKDQFLFNEVNDYMMKVCKLVINTTPVGTFPNIKDELPIPMDQFTEDHLVVDLIYNPERTILLKKAEALGSDVLNGKAMLHAQALKAWEIWNS